MLPGDPPKAPTPNTASSDDTPSPPNPDDIRIDGKIGTDPEELKRWADHVVAGKPIEHMEIADLRALIEAVQKHPGAKLLPARVEGEPRLSDEERRALTRLEIRGGRVASGDCQRLDVRMTLVAKTVFEGEAHFDDATFEGEARFSGATFAGRASFERATFRSWSYFSGTTFEGDAQFIGARLGEAAWFGGATFAFRAAFDHVTFWGVTIFDRAIFRDGTSFYSATFGGAASFGDATFGGWVSFDDAIFGGVAWFGGATFQQTIAGDLRTTDTSGVRATLLNTRRRHAPWIMIGSWQEDEARLASLIAAHRERPWEDLKPLPGILSRVRYAVRKPAMIVRELRPLHREKKAYWRVLRQMARTRMVHGPVGWNLVRSLGRLSILNRVSLVALIAVPVLAAVCMAAQGIVNESANESASIWLRWAAGAIGESPNLSPTLALTFFASVLVTLGLLIYQTFAPDAIKQRDEDEHVRELEARYSDENPSLRGDGLRRSIERLEDQAKMRPHRHPSFVKHHGDTIWIPPRDKPEWFKDNDLSDLEFRNQQREAIRKRRQSDGLESDFESVEEALNSENLMPPKQRPGFVPAAERARICIEEGARAEYWLKSHEKIGWAWTSLVCYLLGIAILLVILFIQCRSVAKAAWWPETVETSKSTG